MYEELINRLRTYTNDGTDDLRNDAADAIERLEVINECYENIINKHERINGDLLKKAKALQSEVEELKAIKEETE